MGYNQCFALTFLGDYGILLQVPSGTLKQPLESGADARLKTGLHYRVREP